MLERRLEHLQRVEKLGASLEIAEDVGYTCETAERFFLFHIQKRWEVELHSELTSVYYH